jgi:ADP-ribosylglycohydrolase
MIGSIIGDIAGSTYEFSCNKNLLAELFPQGSDFTDDTVMLVATAEALLRSADYAETYRAYGAQFPSPKGSYGHRFREWLRAPNPRPYGSWGNGSAMRVGPVGWAFEDLEETLRQSETSAGVTHDHPEGLKGAAATAGAIWLARHGESKEAIRAFVTSRFGYDLTRDCDAIRPTYSFDESCQGTVPEAILAFLDSHSFEHAIRLAISLGGDADTLACITGGIAEAYYREVPREMILKARQILPPSLLLIVDEFEKRYGRS